MRGPAFHPHYRYRTVRTVHVPTVPVPRGNTVPLCTVPGTPGTVQYGVPVCTKCQARTGPLSPWYWYSTVLYCTVLYRYGTWYAENLQYRYLYACAPVLPYSVPTYRYTPHTRVKTNRQSSSTIDNRHTTIFSYPQEHYY